VKFVQVEVREYNRAHGGSAGVPKQGAYTLGLDWKYNDKKVMKRTVSDFESEKNVDSSQGNEFKNYGLIFQELSGWMKIPGKRC
jgi:hypothetical protein